MEKTPPHLNDKDVSSEPDLKNLMIESIDWMKKLHEQNRRIERRMLMSLIAAYIRLALILVPIILGIVYLPPLFRSVWSQYEELLGNAGAAEIRSMFLDNR